MFFRYFLFLIFLYLPVLASSEVIRCKVLLGTKDVKVRDISGDQIHSLKYEVLGSQIYIHRQFSNKSKRDKLRLSDYYEMNEVVNIVKSIMGKYKNLPWPKELHIDYDLSIDSSMHGIPNGLTIGKNMRDLKSNLPFREKLETTIVHELGHILLYNLYTSPRGLDDLFITSINNHLSSGDTSFLRLSQIQSLESVFATDEHPAVEFSFLFHEVVADLITVLHFKNNDQVKDFLINSFYNVDRLSRKEANDRVFRKSIFRSLNSWRQLMSSVSHRFEAILSENIYELKLLRAERKVEKLAQEENLSVYEYMKKYNLNEKDLSPEIPIPFFKETDSYNYGAELRTFLVNKGFIERAIELNKEEVLLGALMESIISVGEKTNLGSINPFSLRGQLKMSKFNKDVISDLETRLDNVSF